MNKIKLYDKLADKNGINLQFVVAIEELSELQKELSKRIRGEHNLENLIEEVADVEVMLEQIIHNLQIREQVNDVKTLKLIRTNERLRLGEDADE